MSSRAPVRHSGTAHCVAIDLGATAARVVEMEWTSGGDGRSGDARLLRRGMASYPTAVWNDLTANRDTLVAALREALVNAGITSRSVVACMPRRLVTLRFARLPHAPPEQMQGMVTFEAQQYILFSLDEVILDYHVDSSPLGFDSTMADDLDTVLLAAARRSLVAEILAIFDQAGLELRQLSVSALALAEHIRDSLEPTALIDLEAGEMDVAVVSEGRLLFTRATTLDIEGVQQDVASRRLAEEVARSFTAYQNEFRQKPLAHVYLTGPSLTSSSTDRLEHDLSDVLDMPVTRLQNRLLPQTDPDVRAYTTAIGLALQTQPGNLASISLVPDERVERKLQRQRRQRQQLGVAAGVLALCMIGYAANGYVVNRHKLEVKTAAANSDLRRAQTQLDAEKKIHDKIQALDTDLTRALDRDHPVVDVLVALNRALPSSANLWLTQLSFDRGGMISLHGETKSASAATDLVLALQESGAFIDVKLGYLGDAQENGSGTTPTPTPRPVTPAPVAGTTVPNSLPGLQNQNPGNGPGGPNQGNPWWRGGGPGGGPGGYGGGGWGGGGFGRRGGFGGGYGGPGGGFGGPGGQGGFGGPGGGPNGGPGGAPNGGPGGPGNFPNNGAPGGPPNNVPGANPAPPLLPPGVTPGPVIQNAAPNGPVNDVPAPAAGRTLLFHRAAPTESKTVTPAKTATPGKTPASGKTVTQPAAGSSNKEKPAASGKATSDANKPADNKPALTSFIITCRVNPRAHSLVPANLKAPVAVQAKPAVKTHDTKVQINPADDTGDDSQDTGDDNAN